MRCLLLMVAIFIATSGFSQYFMRGSVKSEQGIGLYNVRFWLRSKGSVMFYTGSSGSFGVPVNVPSDSIIFYQEGYDTLYASITSGKFQEYVLLKKSAVASTTHAGKVISFSGGYAPQGIVLHGNESYESTVENSFLPTASFPQNSFALNVDCASYSNIRRFLNNGLPVPIQAVRIEEMLNYFDLSPGCPKDAQNSFAISATLSPSPWNVQRKLFFISAKAPALDLSKVPPSSFVFLIDVSGSMDEPNRLPLLQQGLKMMTQNFRLQDTIAIVTYGGGVTILLPPTSGNDKAAILSAIDMLSAGGTTPGEAAIKTAYDIALQLYHTGTNTRVILATDGDFNVGQTSDKQLENLISTYKESGVSLTCLGVGMGNYKDSKLETLSRTGNGNFSYIDNLNEARKVLLNEFTKNLYAVASDASVSCAFNPQLVQSYRLIGFDNKAGNIGVSNELEGGEVGAAQTVTAVYELQMNTDLTLNPSDTLATISVNWKKYGATTGSGLHESKTIAAQETSFSSLHPSLKLASGIIMFGELLKRSTYVAGYSWDEAEKIVSAAVSPSSYTQKELVTLVKKARKIYASIKN